MRRFRLEDGEKVSSYLSEPTMHDYMADTMPCPYPLERARRFVEWAAEMFPLECAVTWNGMLAGAVSLGEQTGAFAPNLERGYWIAKEFQGKGLGREAVAQITRLAFRQEGIQRVFAMVFAQNVPSLRSLAAAGYEREGRMPNALRKGKTLQDCLVFAAYRGSWRK